MSISSMKSYSTRLILAGGYFSFSLCGAESVRLTKGIVITAETEKHALKTENRAFKTKVINVTEQQGQEGNEEVVA